MICSPYRGSQSPHELASSLHWLCSAGTGGEAGDPYAYRDVAIITSRQVPGCTAFRIKVACRIMMENFLTMAFAGLNCWERSTLCFSLRPELHHGTRHPNSTTLLRHKHRDLLQLRYLHNNNNNDTAAEPRSTTESSESVGKKAKTIGGMSGRYPSYE